MISCLIDVSYAIFSVSSLRRHRSESLPNISELHIYPYQVSLPLLPPLLPSLLLILILDSKTTQVAEYLLRSVSERLTDLKYFLAAFQQYGVDQVPNEK
jgi:hypothetical protein